MNDQAEQKEITLGELANTPMLTNRVVPLMSYARFRPSLEEIVEVSFAVPGAIVAMTRAKTAYWLIRRNPHSWLAGTAWEAINISHVSWEFALELAEKSGVQVPEIADPKGTLLGFVTARYMNSKEIKFGICSGSFTKYAIYRTAKGKLTFYQYARGVKTKHPYGRIVIKDNIDLTEAVFNEVKALQVLGAL